MTVEVDGIDVDALRHAVALHRDNGYVILEVSPPLLALVECAEAVLAAHDKGGQWVPWCDEHDALGLPCGGSFIPEVDACRFNPCKRCFPDEGGTR